MSGRHITIETTGGSFTGYLARPGLDGRGPGVVVIQEIFGINTEMRRICDELAREGYVALCPDLFWRIEPEIMLTDNTEAEWGRAFELFQAFDVDQGVDDIGAAVATLRDHEATTGRVGAVGYCLGGMLAFLTAVRTDVDAAVGYYGVGIENRLSEIERMEARLMLHIAGKDEYVPPKAQTAITDALHNHPLVSLHQYPDMDHAFARVGGKHFDEETAATANARTLSFFQEHLA